MPYQGSLVPGTLRVKLKAVMTSTVGRVKRLTVEEVNSKLAAEAQARVAYFSLHPAEIDFRLRELDEEWDIDRAIEVEAAATVLTGFLLGATVSRKWFILPFMAGTMLLLHNLRGGYPLLPLFRRLGFRTAQEIAQERYALKALRGDFENVPTLRSGSPVGDALQAADPSAGPSRTPITTI